MQSHMGANSIVQVKSIGWGSMSTFCNNQGPPFHLERNGLYTYDGQSLKLVVKKDQARRMDELKDRRMALWRMHIRRLIEENPPRTMEEANTTAKIAEAVAQDPEKWAKIAGDTAGTAVDIAGKIKSMIGNSTSDSAMIINLSDSASCNWYTYNQAAPIKLTTTMQSFMGPSSIVRVKSLGWGSMSTYCNNESPPFQIDRGGVYTYDGTSLKLVVQDSRRRRRRFL